MNSNPRGLAVIINNQFLLNMVPRDGTDCDLAMLKKLFKDLKFEVETFPGLSANVSIHILCIIVSQFFNVVVSFLYILSIFDVYIYFMLSLLSCLVLGSFIDRTGGIITIIIIIIMQCLTRHVCVVCLQCFDAVGWMAGRASGL